MAVLSCPGWVLLWTGLALHTMAGLSWFSFDVNWFDPAYYFWHTPMYIEVHDCWSVLVWFRCELVWPCILLLVYPGWVLLWTGLTLHTTASLSWLGYAVNWFDPVSYGWLWQYTYLKKKRKRISIIKEKEDTLRTASLEPWIAWSWPLSQRGPHRCPCGSMPLYNVRGSVLGVELLKLYR